CRGFLRVEREGKREERTGRAGAPRRRTPSQFEDENGIGRENVGVREWAGGNEPEEVRRVREGAAGIQ
ncbi:MAG: hypothetical protein M0P21_11505, partial [Methanoculleus sp.]|nr:hypothetical protein [Methanoculleus sp.]